MNWSAFTNRGISRKRAWQNSPQTFAGKNRCRQRDTTELASERRFRILLLQSIPRNSRARRQLAHLNSAVLRLRRAQRQSESDRRQDVSSFGHSALLRRRQVRPMNRINEQPRICEYLWLARSENRFMSATQELRSRELRIIRLNFERS